MVGYCYGDSTCGQRALYNLGMTGFPITNVNNNGATGGTTLYQVNNIVKSGLVDCALALGFECMASGTLQVGKVYPDRRAPSKVFEDFMPTTEANLSTGQNFGPLAPQLYANAGQEYFDKYGATIKHLAHIAAKNHKHSVNNPYSQFRVGRSVEEILNSPQVCKQLTKYMCCPTSDGAACCIVSSEDFVHAHGLENQAIEIVSLALATDEPSTLEKGSAMDLVGFSMTTRCADMVFMEAGFKLGDGRDDVGVVELHDCFATNELITYDALGLCAPGEAHTMVEHNDNTYGGKYVVNPSGGLEGKGNPIGATGVGLHFSIIMQLRGWAGPMQAPNLFSGADTRGKYGLVHNIGMGGAVVCSLLRRPEFFRAGGKDGRDRLGYNHACECRSVTLAEVNKVKARRHSPFILQHALKL